MGTPPARGSKGPPLGNFLKIGFKICNLGHFCERCSGKKYSVYMEMVPDIPHSQMITEVRASDTRLHWPLSSATGVIFQDIHILCLCTPNHHKLGGPLPKRGGSYQTWR